jgi:hypothetical protein
MNMNPRDPDAPPIPEKAPVQEPTRDPRIPDPRVPPNPPGTPTEPDPNKIRVKSSKCASVSLY